MHVQRTDSAALAVNTLPDGSVLIVDSTNETVFALNPTASAAWNACSEPTTLSRVTEEMRRSFDSSTTEDLAQEALLQLEEQKLVKTSAPASTRRAFLGKLGVAAALPLVVSLPITEQRAYATRARSTVHSKPPKNDGGLGGLLGWLGL